MDASESTAPQADTPSRRSFMLRAIALLSGIVAVLCAWPLISFLVAPSYRRLRPRFYRVAKLSEIPENQPTRFSFPFTNIQGYIQINETRDLWVIKRSDTDLTVFSPICTHLACRFDLHAAAKQFVCPCHGSVFTLDGKVLAGPAPRPLDTLPWKIENGELLVQWEIYKSGIARKVVA